MSVTRAGRRSRAREIGCGENTACVFPLAGGRDGPDWELFLTRHRLEGKQLVVSREPVPSSRLTASDAIRSCMHGSMPSRRFLDKGLLALLPTRFVLEELLGAHPGVLR